MPDEWRKADGPETIRFGLSSAFRCYHFPFTGLYPKAFQRGGKKEILRGTRILAKVDVGEEHFLGSASGQSLPCLRVTLEVTMSIPPEGGDDAVLTHSPCPLERRADSLLPRGMNKDQGRLTRWRDWNLDSLKGLP